MGKKKVNQIALEQGGELLPDRIISSRCCAGVSKISFEDESFDKINAKFPERIVLSRKISIISKFVDSGFLISGIKDPYEQRVIDDFIKEYPNRFDHEDALKIIENKYYELLKLV